MKRKVRGNAAGSLGFGGCPSAAHAGLVARGQEPLVGHD